MDSLSSKISFYDFLNILARGFLLLNLGCNFATEKGIDWIFISIASFLIGLVYHQLMECTIGKVIRNCKWITQRAYEKVKNDIGISPMSDCKPNTYLKAYYMVAKNNCLMNIPVLEAHIAFVRNIWPILLIYVISLCVCPLTAEKFNAFINPCYAAIGITTLLVLLPFIWYRLQTKVSYLVWEGACFINHIMKNENEKNNP